MKKMVRKNTGKMVKAYELGTGTVMEQKMLEEGKMVIKPNGQYELFSQESKSGKGEIANAGDFFKVDGAGFPYPNERIWFDANHKHIAGYDYEQIPKPLMAWEKEDEISPEIEFLIEHKGLIINPDDSENFFGAELWGAWLTAAEDAVLIFYSVSYDESDAVTDADFNFVARNEFNDTYHYC